MRNPQELLDKHLATQDLEDAGYKHLHDDGRYSVWHRTNYRKQGMKQYLITTRTGGVKE